MLVGMYSNQGGREYNEDSCTALKKGNLLCAVMADGLGGHGGGDVASKTAVEVIRSNFKKLKGTDEITQLQLNDWFEQANKNVLALQNDRCQMKTTMAVLGINADSGKANWAHLGDSRIYHFIDGKEAFCTFDHSVSRMAVLAGEISLDEVRFHKDRSKLLKVVGKENVGLPEYGDTQLERGHQHTFLLCTDGFWEYVTEQEMESTLIASKEPEEWLRQMYYILSERVKQNNVSNDNNSAIAVFV
jgi:serine/threonine protein phosphatase PrpC